MVIYTYVCGQCRYHASGPNSPEKILHRSISERDLCQGATASFATLEQVAILTSWKGSLTVETDSPWGEDTDKEIGLRVAHQHQIPLLSQATVLVMNEGSGLMFVTSFEKFARHNLDMTTRGVIEVVPNRPCYVLVTKASKKKSRCPREC